MVTASRVLIPSSAPVPQWRQRKNITAKALPSSFQLRESLLNATYARAYEAPWQPLYLVALVASVRQAPEVKKGRAPAKEGKRYAAPRRSQTDASIHYRFYVT